MRIKLEIEVELSDENEATESPWWAIVNPVKNLRVDLDVAAAQITGPFFDRGEADAHLKNRRYAFGKKAAVYCFSGYWSPAFKAAVRAAIAAQKMPGHWQAVNGDNHGLNSKPGDVWVPDGPLCPKEAA